MFDPTTFTGFHTWLSLVALALGLILTFDLVRGRLSPRLAGAFLAFALAASLTGFGFPFSGILPSHVVGVVSVVALVVAVVVLLRSGAAARESLAFQVAVALATYLLVFVAVAQSFQKIPALGGPTTAFAVAEGLLLLVFAGLAVVALRRRSRPVLAAPT